MDHLIQVRQLDCRSLRRLLREVETGKIRAPQPGAIKQLGSFPLVSSNARRADLLAITMFARRDEHVKDSYLIIEQCEVCFALEWRTLRWT